MEKVKKVNLKERAKSALIIGLLLVCLFTAYSDNFDSEYRVWYWVSVATLVGVVVGMYMKIKKVKPWDFYDVAKKIKEWEEKSTGFVLDISSHNLAVTSCSYSPTYTFFYFCNNGYLYAYDRDSESVMWKEFLDPYLKNSDIEKSRRLDLDYSKESDKLRLREKEFKDGVFNEAKEE